MTIEKNKQTLLILKERFERHKERHADLNWEDVEKRLNEKILDVLTKMEDSGGEPDLVLWNGRMIFCDLSPEPPSGRRSLCYDEAALRQRAKNPPSGSVEAMAKQMGVSLMDEALYLKLQEYGDFDLKTSSWIKTPEEIRKKGGALFGETRYGRTFIFHNGASSYYSVRGWRGYITI